MFLNMSLDVFHFIMEPSTASMTNRSEISFGVDDPKFTWLSYLVSGLCDIWMCSAIVLPQLIVSCVPLAVKKELSMVRKWLVDDMASARLITSHVECAVNRYRKLNFLLRKWNEAVGPLVLLQCVFVYILFVGIIAVMLKDNEVTGQLEAAVVWPSQYALVVLALCHMVCRITKR